MSSGSYLYERAQNHYRFNQRMRIAGLEIQGSLAASFSFFRRWLWAARKSELSRKFDIILTDFRTLCKCL